MTRPCFRNVLISFGKSVNGFPGEYKNAETKAINKKIKCPACKYDTPIPSNFPLPNIDGMISN